MKRIIEVLQDQYPLNPRTEQDNLGYMVCWHRRYELGDAHTFRTPDDFNKFIKEHHDTIYLPLFLYDHGGLTISTKPFSCLWDSGQVGWIYVTQEKLKYQGLSNRLPGDIKTYLNNEVEVYDKYLRGECYYYTIKTENNEIIDSCSGFYSEKEALQYAQSNLE